MSGWMTNYAKEAYHTGRRYYAAYVQPSPPTKAEEITEKVAGFVNATVDGVQELGKGLESSKEMIENAAQVGNSLVQAGKELLQDANDFREGPQAKQFVNSLGEIKEQASQFTVQEPMVVGSRT